jgi:hypothetical protein
MVKIKEKRKMTEKEKREKAKELKELMKACELYIMRCEKIKKGDVFELSLSTENDISVVCVKCWSLNGGVPTSKDISFDIRQIPSLIRALEETACSA